MSNAFQIRLSPGLHDFNPILAGEGSPSPGGNTYPSEYVNCILIHHVVRGRGIVTINGKTFHAKAGQIFIINTANEAYYYSGFDDPWFYRWVGFTGELSEHFEDLPPVLDVDEDPFPSLQYLQDPTKPLDYMLAGDLFHLYCKFLQPKNKKLDHINQIINHIQANYKTPLSVEDFAKQYGLDRRYLSRQFKKRTGFTIRGYITNVRVDAARHFLMDGYSGKEVAALCGFSDPSNFYKTFKDHCGMNPSDWRKDQLSKTETYWKKP